MTCTCTPPQPGFVPVWMHPTGCDLYREQMGWPLSKPPRLARVEVGQAMHDRLYETAPEGASPDSPRQPTDWTPPSPGGSVFSVPVVLREDLAPRAWRLLGHDGEVIAEGTA